ncbi:hypothetical protein CQA66_08105 [Helicobacter aurati]|uniref:ABC-type transport auxiliary lipoprotein component domain-containing protein n=1 Tax=Helicobacter aurati TaxID=137778 RepID=A0A3D8J0Z3_9HELI|nr:hypothetical protein [Helicobacter aurati]RDU70514.1 hypothetical protein CQA66_08105 [Helicobacter aurati]
MQLIQYIGIAVLATILQGCITVKLKSVLPEQAYYSLDNIKLEPHCKAMNASFGIHISILSPYDGKDILVYDEQSQIKILPYYKWIDLPKNMIRNSIIKAGLNACIQVEQTPSINQKLNTLQIHINELYVERDSQNQNYTGYVYLDYELKGFDSKRIKNGIVITTTKDSNPVKSLQNAMNESIQKILTQIKMS